MANPRITFHVPTEGGPEKLLPLLGAIQEEQATFSSAKHLGDFARERGLGDRIETQILARAAGLLKKNQQGQITLSQEAQTITQLKSSLQADIVHYLLYTIWQPSQPAQNSFLWSYRQVVNSYWLRGKAQVVETANIIAEEINNQTQSVFVGVAGYNFGEVSFSAKSIRGVRKWLEALIPPVIEDNIFTRRTFCPPELTLLAAGWVAETMEGEPGIDFLLTPPRREAICQLCLLEANALDSVLDWMLPHYPEIVQPGTTAGVYGRYLRFLRFPEITNLV